MGPSRHARLSFGELLAWHLMRGTRPPTSVRRGRRWGKKEFADAVGVSDRQVRYWLKNESRPPEIETIERIIFGENQKYYPDWRLELRQAHERAWSGTAPGDGALSGDYSKARKLAPPFVGVPSRVVSFTGRSEELDALAAILERDKSPAVIQSTGRAAVQGLGGVGKTSLAIEYAIRFRDLYGGVWWCQAEVRTSLLTSLAALAVKLGAVRPDEADIGKAAKAAINGLAEQPVTWLLIYDNVTGPEEVADLLPVAGARVLITSRFPDWGDWAVEVALDVLSLEEAVEFLQKRTGLTDESGARILAETLGCLPLALNHAAAYCKRTQMAFTEYSEMASSLIGTEQSGLAYPRTVVATFNLAIKQAVARCLAADPLVAFLGHCAPDRIPMILIQGGNR